MKARKVGGSDEKPTIQPHLSRVVRIVNLGLQPGFMWQGEMTEPDYKLEFTFEVCDEHMKDGKPFFVGREINNKDAPKSNLFQWMAACGADCDHIEASLGKAVSMTPKVSAKGWVSVDNISGLPPSLQSSVPELVNEPIIFDFTDDNPDMDTWDKIPEFTRNKVLNALDIKDYPFFAKLTEQDDM